MSGAVPAMGPHSRSQPALLAVPNVSEGRALDAVAAIGAAFSAVGVRLLDVHVDPDHHRSVFTLAGDPGELAASVVAGAFAARDRIDLRTERGSHPHVGVLDVCPIVFLTEQQRGAAVAEALIVGHELGEAGIPVFLYGRLADGRTRAELRRGGPSALAARLASGDVRPDFGPARMDPAVGATLVTARPPLLAFNCELASPASADLAREVAAKIREGGEAGLPGVRALGLALPARGGVAQVTCNIEDHRAVALVDVLDAVQRFAPVAECEVVGLPPRAAYHGFPDAMPVRHRRVLEDLLGVEESIV